MKKHIWSRLSISAKVFGSILIVFAATSIVHAYDVNGDGREGLPESIHSLQVTAGLIPSSSTIVYVGPVGTQTENGTALINALSGITDASYSKPYLLKIEPGIYDLGNAVLVMKPYVDIEGSGEMTTTITSMHSGDSASNSATISGAGHTEIRFLRIENHGGSSFSVALYNHYTPIHLTNVTLTASGGNYNYGVFNDFSSATMTNVTTSASGGNTAFGVYNLSSITAYNSITMTNVTAMGLSGLNNYGVVNNHILTGKMTNITVAASSGGTGDGYNYGVHNSMSRPTMTDVTITASGGASNYGVYNQSSSSPQMTNVMITVSGGSAESNVYGIYNDSSSPIMANVTAYAIGGTLGIGVSSTGSVAATKPMLIIQNSSLNGTTSSITNSGLATAKVGATLLNGPVTGSNFTCIGAYTASFTALNASCL